MRIGVDACTWSNARGYGRFTREILRAMVAISPSDEFVCFIDQPNEEAFDLRFPNVRAICVEQSAAPTEAAAAEGHRPLSDVIKMMRATNREQMDVFFSPSVYTYFPLPFRLPAVITIHDAIAERFPEMTLPSARSRLFWNLKVRLALWQAQRILTVSDYAARDLVSTLKIPPARIRVTSEAPAPVYRPSESLERIRQAGVRVGVPPGASWLIYVGGFNPHKHVDIVIRAHASIALKSKGVPVHLILVGDPERDVFYRDLERIRATITEAGTGHLVIWAGFVPDQELRHLYSGAIALLLPSECEGFGLPAVEAAACGTPVVATMESPLPELLKGGGLFIEPGDLNAVIYGLRSLLTDESKRKKMGAIARQQASKLSWVRSAGIVLKTLREVLQ